MKRLMLAVAGVLLLAGCLGKSGPVEEYLRLGQAGACAESLQGGARTGVGLRKLRTVEALDRQAVMLAQGRTMSPSQRWYWESPPGRMVETALAQALDCSDKVAAVWPVRYDSSWSVGLTGSVERFEVLAQEKTFAAAVAFQAWDARGGTLLGSRTVAVSEPLDALDAQAVARAGATAMKRLGQETRAWIESLVQPVPAKAAQ